MGKGSKPDIPNTQQLVSEQQRVGNEQMWNQIRASRPNQSNPYGSTTWTHTPRFDETGYNAARQTWESQNSDYLRQQQAWQAAQGQPGDNGNPLTGAAPPSAPNGLEPTRNQFTTYDASSNTRFTGPMARQWRQTGNLMRDTLGAMDPNARVDLIDDVRGMYSDELADAIYNRSTRLSNPQFEEAQRGLETRMAERGFQVGNEGYDTEMDRFQRGMSEHYSDAADRAQIQAAQQSLAEAGFTNNSRLSEFGANEGHKLALANALSNIQSQMSAGLYGGFAPTGGGFSSPAVDVAGLYGQNYNAQMDAYNAAVGESNALWGTALTAASLFFPPAAAAIPASQQSQGAYWTPPNYNLASGPPQSNSGLRYQSALATPQRY
jgi:hypothetical protein